MKQLLEIMLFIAMAGVPAFIFAMTMLTKIKDDEKHEARNRKIQIDIDILKNEITPFLEKGPKEFSDN